MCSCSGLCFTEGQTEAERGNGSLQVTGPSTGARALTAEAPGHRQPPSPSQDAHGPAYLRIAAPEQPFLLQQADEVVTQGRLEGSNHNDDRNREGSPQRHLPLTVLGTVPVLPHGIITLTL